MSLSDAGRIHAYERDYSLLTRWASPDPEFLSSWTMTSGNTSYSRTHQRKDDCPITETIHVFPSAPIYGIHRKREHQLTLNRLNQHTFRLLRREDSRQIRRIYILHNGLNEIDTFGFYYRIAEEFLRQPDVACIIRPFPGHLTRQPFPMAYSQRPLDSYLLDAGNLFRQYLRYMLETQWLLSALVPCVDYRVVAGTDLLARSGRSQRGNRADPIALANEIVTHWTSIWEANGQRVDDRGETIDQSALCQMIRELRTLLGWEQSPADRGQPPNTFEDLLPYLHVVGYSLGGFTAQSVFFAWPFAVSSCTTICSGGALRDVGLTAFAHHEEWKSIVHSLAFEIESAMVEPDSLWHLNREKNAIAGVDAHYFSCFYKIFRDVFLQESRGSYSSKVSEYVSRLFFIVGGQDPIVTLDAVHEASPPEGLNLFEIANLSHFPMKGDKEWQQFWLPKLCRLMQDFSERTERGLLAILRCQWCDDTGTSWPWYSDTECGVAAGRPPVRQQDLHTGNEALNSEAFQLELDAIVREFVANEMQPGILFILRNNVPSALLGDNLLHRRGTSLHHSDPLIRRYVVGLQTRRMLLLNHARRQLRLVVPSHLEGWFSGPQPVFSPAAEAAYSRVPSSDDLQKVWVEFKAQWCPTGVLRLFDPDTRSVAPAIGDAGRWKNVAEINQLMGVNTLPDIWLAISSSARVEIRQAEQRLGGECVPTDDSALIAWALELHKLRFSWKMDAADGDLPAQAVQLRRLVSQGEVRLVKVSGARFNPRFMGWRIRNFHEAQRLIVHAALAYVRSYPAS